MGLSVGLEVWRPIGNILSTSHTEDNDRAGSTSGDLPSQEPKLAGDLIAGVKAAPEERNRHCENDSGYCTHT